MRHISETFLNCLKSGFLSEVTEAVRRDHDLNLEIRESYINICYKGNSLLKLTEVGSLPLYKSKIHQKFLEGITVSLVLNDSTATEFVKCEPTIRC